MNTPDDWIEEAEASQAAQEATPTETADDTNADKPLNTQQIRFVDEYRRNGERNAAAAYLRAGYECASMSSAAAAASRLLKQVNVKAELKRRRDEDRRLASVSREEIIREVARRAFARPADLIDLQTGKFRPGLSSDDLSIIAGFAVEEKNTLYGKDVRTKPEVEARAKYMDLLIRLLGLDNSNINVSMSQTPTVIRDTIPDIRPDALPGFLAGLSVAGAASGCPADADDNDDTLKAADDA